ncbi:MAG: flavin reductase family protein [Pseudomonadota bacterium]
MRDDADVTEPMPQPFSQRELRTALGCFATGVTLVTTLSKTGPLGMTVNSFASVSLDPPLVLWSPARKSDRFPAFEAASHFAIHVLTEDQQALAERFARDGLDFSGIGTEEGVGGTPLLQEFAARFQCARAAGHDGGDHLIVVGEVLSFEHRDARPLLYHKGGFAALSAS